MTAAQLMARTLKRLDEDAGGGFYTPAEALVALNRGQRLFVLLTLCLETTATLPLDAGVVWYRLLDEFGTFLLPLRLRVAGAGGAKVRPARLADLDALSATWQAAEGTPARYACLGFDQFAIYPHPAAGGTSLDVTLAFCPSAMTEGSTPEIPEEDHPALIDFAIPVLRLKEGGQEFAKSLRYLDRFFEAAAKRAAYVRARSLEQRYDRVPVEWERWDRSRLVALAMKKAKPAWLAIPQAEDSGGR